MDICIRKWQQSPIGKINNGNKDYTSIFVDFKKVFSSIGRDVMIGMLV